MIKILFATGNESKGKRFSLGLNKHNIEVLTLKDIKETIDVEENGKSAKENAIIKAKAYYEISKMPTMAMDDALYLDNVPDDVQPGLFVRRVNGKRLNDEELLNHFIDLVKKYGKDGKITARWKYGLAVIINGKLKTYEWSKEDFYLTDKVSDKLHIGYPLDSISINKTLNKYFTDITEEDKEQIKQNEDDVVDFIVKCVEEGAKNDK